MKKRLSVAALLFFIFLLFFTNSAMANDYSFRLSANQKALDAEITGLFNVSDKNLRTSFSGVYDNDDYKILFLNVSIENDVFIDGLTAGLGLRSAWGEAEKKHIDGDILNLGFAGYVAYDLSKTTMNEYPVTFLSSICLSPEPLSFQDTDEFFEFLAECSWKLLDHAALVASYRYIEIDFDNRKKWEKSDNAVYMGFRFHF